MIRRFLQFFLIFTSFGLGACLHAQVTGVVRDAETGDSLAFAYVLRLGTEEGCFSGLDGRFSLPQARVGDSIQVHLMGYDRQTLAVPSSRVLEVALQPGGVKLADVLIQPTENPALRIMRLAVAQRQANDPQNQSHFSCDTYNKLTASPNATGYQADSLFRKIHLFLSETVTHRLQIRPGKVQEEIVSARLAGYPGKVIPFTASDLQDLSFYANYVSVFGQKFLSPISPPGLHQYRFTLRDTLVVGEDSIFTIDFEPKGNAFDGFAGNLRIHSQRWALTTAQVKLVQGEGGLLIDGGEIKQIYAQLPEGLWMPSELTTEINTKPLSGDSPMTFHMSGYSIITHYVLHDSTRGRFRPEDEVVVAPGAGQEDSTLRAGRYLPLSAKDSLSYHKLDSFGRAVGLSRVIDQTWKLADGRLGIGVLDLLLDLIITRNQIERARLGIGLATNEQMSKRFSISGYFGWGFRDQRAKFGGQFLLTPLGDDRLYGGVAYSQDLQESGFRRLGMRPEVGLHQNLYRESQVRRWYLRDMDYITTSEAWVGVRLPTDLGLRVARRWEQVQPAYNYTFSDSSQFRFDEVEAMLRWAPGARYMHQGSRRVLTSNHAPIFQVRYTQGLESEHGDYAYHALAGSVFHQFSAFRGGSGIFFLNAGWNDRSLPRSRMRVYRSNYAKGNFTDLSNAFNTMRYDEFAADMYAEGFVYLSPKLRWLHLGPKIYPQVTLAMSGAWGKLYGNALNHAPMQLRAPSHFYWEPGVTITNLLPKPKKDNVFSAVLRGIGVGFYYRVGAYSFPTFKENFAFRLSLGRL